MYSLPERILIAILIVIGIAILATMKFTKLSAKDRMVQRMQLQQYISDSDLRSVQDTDKYLIASINKIVTDLEKRFGIQTYAVTMSLDLYYCKDYCKLMMLGTTCIAHIRSYSGMDDAFVCK